MYVAVKFWLAKIAHLQIHFQDPTGNFPGAPLGQYGLGSFFESFLFVQFFFATVVSFVNCYKVYSGVFGVILFSY